jgi:sialidase-1
VLVKNLPLLLFACLLPLVPCPASGEQVDVFVSGSEGYHTFRIPAVIAAADGTLLAFCEGRRDGPADRGKIDLVLKRSTDGGRHWGPLQVVWADSDNTCGNPCPVVDAATGTIWLFATHNLGPDREADIITKRSQGTRTAWLLHSTDNGATWSEPRAMPHLKDPSWGWYATGPGIGIQIRHGAHAGRLVIPCVHSYDDPTGDLRGGPYNYGSHVVFSDDHGATWQLGGVARPKVNECQLAELSTPPGTLLLNMRSYHAASRRAESLSTDGGASWTPLRDHPALTEPVCQATILRHSWPAAGAPGVLLFANPDHPQERQRMTVRMSIDDGHTWPRSLVLHADFAAYCSLVSLSADAAGCLYERGSGTGRGLYERITFARFALPLPEQGSTQPAK